MGSHEENALNNDYDNKASGDIVECQKKEEDLTSSAAGIALSGGTNSERKRCMWSYFVNQTYVKPSKTLSNRLKGLKSGKASGCDLRELKRHEKF